MYTRLLITTGVPFNERTDNASEPEVERQLQKPRAGEKATMFEIPVGQPMYLPAPVFTFDE